MGRPAAEIQPIRDEVIRPFSEFGRLGIGNDTDTIQKAIDWSQANGVPVGQSGTFNVDGLVIRDGARIVNPGSRRTLFKPIAVPTAAAAILLDSGPVQHAELSGLTLDMSDDTSGQHGIYLRAVPTLVDGVIQGGLWYSRFRDIQIVGCTGESFWLRGGGNLGGDPAAFAGPHQFLKLERVIIIHGSATTRALRISGQVGQVGYDEDCEFDLDPALGGGGTNILIERDVNDDGTNRSDMAPYTHLFKGVTVQNNDRGVTIERATSIHFLGGHFENVIEGVLNRVSAYGNIVEGVEFANCGYRGDGTGYGCRSEGGLLLVRDNKFISSSDPVACETHYVGAFGQEIHVQGRHYDSTGIRTSGVTHAAIPSGATLALGGYNHHFVNGPNATAIDTITSDLTPGELLTIRANAGYIVLGSGGNIDFSPFYAPLRVPQDAVVTLQRDDLIGKWKVVALSGPQGHRRPLITYIAVADSPYSVPPGSGTIHVDSSGGNVEVRLPSKSSTSPGERVTVKKISTDSNEVRVNGATSGENPDSAATNATKLIRANQAMDFERDATVGVGGWKIVSGGPNVASATLTFGTHLTGTSYDGSAPVTIGTDATSANTASTIMARDSSGAFSSGKATHISSGINVTVLELRSDSASGSGDELRMDYSQSGIALGRIASFYDGGGFGLRLYGYSGGLHSTPAFVITSDKKFILGADPNSGEPIRTQQAATSSEGIAYSVMGLYSSDGQGANVGAHIKLGGTFITALSSIAGYASIGGVKENSTSGNFAGALVFYARANGANLAEAGRFNSDKTFTFQKGGTIGGGVTINTASGATGIDVTDTAGNTGISFTPVTGSSVFIDNRRVGATTQFRSSNASAADRVWLSVTAAGVPTFGFNVIMSGSLTLGTSLTTGAPSGGSAVPIKLGTRVSGVTVTLDTGHYVQAEINGTVVQLALVN